MSNSSKNILQEYFQAKGVSLPIYDTGRSGGEDHKPEWVSQVTLHDGSIYVSDGIFLSKAEAEKSAAGIALKNLGLIKDVSNKKQWKTIHDVTHVYIDVENMARLATELLKLFAQVGPPPKIDVSFCMSKGCNLVDRIRSELSEKKYHSVKCCITDSLLPDAADMLICAYATITMNKGVSVVIASNDRFANTFVAVTKNLFPKGCIRNITSKSEFMEWLRP